MLLSFLVVYLFFAYTNAIACTVDSQCLPLGKCVSGACVLLKCVAGACGSVCGVNTGICTTISPGVCACNPNCAQTPGLPCGSPQQCANCDACTQTFCEFNPSFGDFVCSYAPLTCDPYNRTTCDTNNVCTSGGCPQYPVCTPSPTAAPTTKAPTNAPTTAPTTKAPTNAPTTAPTTKAPTNAPTAVPTTGSPTGVPTSTPTPSPTNTPTPLPTDAPTGSPTSVTTPFPTGSPTEEPTTGSPTEEVTTGSPTSIQTGSPTMEATGAPTSTQTDSPTDTITSSPTMEATGSPTSIQTDPPTDALTSSPTMETTGSPTVEPTSFPTMAPTNGPTSAPTNEPTSPPTNTPTGMPTPAPTSCIPMINGIPTITMRQYSTSPTLGNGGTGMNTDPSSSNYGALRFFINYVNQYTSAINETLNFVVGAPWSTSSTCTVLKQVGQTSNICPQQQAAYDAGDQMNPELWGFIFDSGITFSMPFGRFTKFLSTVNGNETGLQTLQRILDRRGANVKVLPVLGSPRQSSGFFSVDLSTKNGFRDLCRGNYSWRFSQPAFEIINRTCRSLYGASATKINDYVPLFGQSVPKAVQQRYVSAFEFGAALDNYRTTQGGFFPPLGGPSPTCATSSTPSFNNPPPQCYQNPGHIGIRYMHYPSWHAPFQLGFIFINMDLWHCLSSSQQRAVETAANAALVDSYDTSSGVECSILKQMLSQNDREVQRNPDGTVRDCDLSRSGVQSCSADMKLVQYSSDLLVQLRSSRDAHLNSLRGSSPVQQDYVELLDRYLAYERKTNFVWKPDTGCVNNLS